MWAAIWFNWLICAITSLCAEVSNGTVLSPCSVPDESLKEKRGVADDARGAGLLVLTALEGQSVIHVTFRMQACLERTPQGEKRARNIAMRRYKEMSKEMKEENALSHSVWNTGADTTGHLAVFTCRTHAHPLCNSSQETRSIFSRGRDMRCKLTEDHLNSIKSLLSK